MPTPFSSSFEEQPSIFAYAHTVCYEPLGGSAVINVNYRNNLNLPTNLTWQLTGLPIGDAEWQLFDRWSDLQTGGEYDYEISAGAPIQVQTTGFVVQASGTYQVESSLHLHHTTTDTRNIAMQIGRKRGGTWQRLGTPSISGYIKNNNSQTSSTVTNNVSHIVQCQAGDEVGLFTTRVGMAGNVTAIRKTSSFRILRLA